MNNLVAKHARKFNKAVVMRDRKKDYTRKGKSKFSHRKAERQIILLTASIPLARGRGDKWGTYKKRFDSEVWLVR